MIVSQQHRYVYIAIPKAGSQSVARWLVDHYAGTAEGYHHAWDVPTAYSGYFVFTGVRNPYDRCFSAWWYRCREPSRQAGNAMFGWSFDRFMLSVMSYRETASRRPTAAAESSLTQKQYADLSGAQLALQIESPDQLAQLPFVSPPFPPLPRHNENRTKPGVSFADYFASKEERLVWDYCAEDFAAFGYVRRPLP